MLLSFTTRTSHQWCRLGVLSGAALGGVGASLYCLSFNGLDLPALMFYLATGGLAGAIAGGLVGLWCAHKRDAEARRAVPV